MWERLVGWGVSFFSRHWVTIVLYALLTSAIAATIEQSNWVREDWLFLPIFILGLFLGLLLARSRFPGWFAVVYALVIGAFTALEVIGRIIPTLAMLFSRSWIDTINGMNLRAFQLYLRILGWVAALQAGDTIRDTGLFLILLCFILFLCGVWLAWCAVRWRNSLAGLLPLALLFAVNVHFSRQSLFIYAAFLLSAILLIAHSAFTGQHEEWQRRRVDFPEQLGLEWGGSAVAMALLVVILARAAPLIGTPQGWRAISEWVQSYQEQSEETAERLFGAVNTPPPASGGSRRVRVNTPYMSEIGRPIPIGYETVMWVTTSDPAPLPEEVAGRPTGVVNRIHYWRSGIYSNYTGRGWNPAALLDETVALAETLPEEPLEGRYYLTQRFSIEAVHGGKLFSVSEPAQVSEDVSVQSVSPDGSLLLEGQVNEYEVISLATDVTANQLILTPEDYPEEILAVYLQLPDDLPQRVRALAARVAGSDDPYYKALNIQNYLRANYPYDLGAQPAPRNRDLVDYFLFDLQRGFCSHYASAMVVMLRTVDVPARVVTGYAMGDWDARRTAYHVAVSASHAWVEVYFPGYGWIEFEPTAYRSAIDYPEDSSAGGPASPPPPVVEKPTPTPRPLIIALTGLGALLLLALPFALMRLFRGSRRDPEVQIKALYRQVRRALGLAGLSAVPSVTPDEYLARYSDHLVPYQRLHTALHQSTALYREMIYSPRSPDAARVKIASQVWQSALRDWLRLWGQAKWKRARDWINKPG